MKNLSKIFAIICLTVTFTSCLKDDDILKDQKFGTNNVDGNQIIEYAGTSANFKTSVLEIADTPQVITRTVRLASDKTLTTDVNVTADVDQAALSAYNATISEAAERYDMIATDAYTVEPAVIKAGERTGTITIKVITSKLNREKNNALALMLKTDKNLLVSGNFGTALIGVALPNVYEGEYESIGVFTHPTSGDRPIHEDKTLSTVNRTTSETTLGDLGASNYLMWLKVDAANKVTFTAKGATPNITETGVNFYDPITKSFTLNYQYTPAGGAPRKVSEVIKRK